MHSKDQLAPHIDSLARRYLAEEPNLAFDEYLEAICHYCPNEWYLMRFIKGDATLQDLRDRKNEFRRELLVLEARLLLLRAWAESGREGYEKVREEAAAILEVDMQAGLKHWRSWKHVIGAHLGYARTARGSFVKKAMEIKGDEILEDLAGYYSAIDKVPVTPEQLRQQAAESHQE